MRALIIQSGKHKGKKLRLPDRFDQLLIGKSEDCQIRLNHPDVAERHCRLIGKGPELRVEDLGSKSGTFVNGEAVKDSRVLTAGDVLRIGPLSLLVAQVPASEKAQAGQQRPATHQIDEDAIVDWLLGEEPGASTVPSPPPAPAPAATIPKPKKRFASVAEEAADIIRRWKEMQAGKQERAEPASDVGEAEQGAG